MVLCCKYSRRTAWKYTYNSFEYRSIIHKISMPFQVVSVKSHLKKILLKFLIASVSLASYMKYMYLLYRLHSLGWVACRMCSTLVTFANKKARIVVSEYYLRYLNFMWRLMDTTSAKMKFLAHFWKEEKEKYTWHVGTVDSERKWKSLSKKVGWLCGCRLSWISCGGG